MDEPGATILKSFTSGELWTELQRRKALLPVAGYNGSNEQVIVLDKIQYVHPEESDYVQYAYVFNAHPEQLG